MAERYLLYYITDRTAFPGDEHTRRHRLLDKIAEAASVGVNYIQLREKDLSSHDLEFLAREAIRIIRDSAKLRTALLINTRTDVALATAAAGVHLPANDVSAAEVRKVWNVARPRPCVARRLCPRNLTTTSRSSPSPVTTLEEVAQAAARWRHSRRLRSRVRKKGRTRSYSHRPRRSPPSLPRQNPGSRTRRDHSANAESCLRAGAAGIAAIRLFQENDIAAIVRTLGGLLTKCLRVAPFHGF